MESYYLGPYHTFITNQWRTQNPISRNRTMCEGVCSFCGSTFIARIDHISSGHTRSCGCQGMVTPSIFGPSNVPRKVKAIHRNLVRRCTVPSHHKYLNYGGQGVKVCDRWLNPQLFLEDVKTLLTKQGLTLEDWGRRKDQYSLDRKDPFGDYTPSNVRFATPKEQRSNQRARG